MGALPYKVIKLLVQYFDKTLSIFQALQNIGDCYIKGVLNILLRAPQPNHSCLWETNCAHILKECLIFFVYIYQNIWKYTAVRIIWKWISCLSQNSDKYTHFHIWGVVDRNEEPCKIQFWKNGIQAQNRKNCRFTIMDRNAWYEVFRSIMMNQWFLWFWKPMEAIFSNRIFQGSSLWSTMSHICREYLGNDYCLFGKVS